MRIRPFSEGDTFATFRNHIQKTTSEIEALENDYVLKASPVELEQYYISRVLIAPLELDVENRYIDDQGGTQIDVSHDIRRAGFGGRPILVRGTTLHIAIPFTGDPELWRIRPSTFGFSGYPKLEIRDNVIVFKCSFPDDAAESQRLKEDIEKTIDSLSQGVANLAKDVENHNKEAPNAVRTILQQKLSNVRAAVSAVADLGIPIRQRSVPDSFVAPTKRRESPVPRPTVPTRKFSPEPSLEQQEFEHILRVLKSMSLVIERCPASFATLDEEGIRTHFLLQLNGHYEGSATGETFNKSGKTDILIRVGDRNVFVAECKFWRGGKTFCRAVDQLLSYLSWRDSKCALLVFNRTKDSSSVGQKMHEIMRTRAEHRETNSYKVGDDARYTFVKPSDPGREIHIHTMLFDIPMASNDNASGGGEFGLP